MPALFQRGDIRQTTIATIVVLPNAMPIEGEIQLIYKGKTIGGIGISGASSEDDGKIARVGADYLQSLKN
jgi:glc operon protein GlcG